MAQDPRKYLRPGCRLDQKTQINKQQQRRNFINSLGDVGNLEFLNDAGAGGIGQGLRDLASLSNGVREGTSVGQTLNLGLDAVNQGGNAVLEAVGIDPNKAAQASQFNPGIVNAAQQQAENIYNDVQRGDFSTSDIPFVAQDLQNLETLIKGINVNQPQRPETKVCTASPYATELIRYAPKHKFMFVLDVEFSPPYKEWDVYGKGMAFVVKRSSRPKVEIEYQEVNMYNFRTNVPKRVKYEPMELSFYDDNKNYAQLFYTAYLRATSPISNIKFDQKRQNDFYEQNSMDFATELSGGTFSRGDPRTRGYTASLGPFNDNAKSVLNEIRLFHIFDYGNLINVYHFYNPRIQEFTPNELTMQESGEGSDLELSFNYDSMFIDPGYSLKENDGEYNIEQLSGGDGRAERYFIDPVFDADDGTTSHGAPKAQDQTPTSETFEDITDDVTGAVDTATGLTKDTLRKVL